MTKKESIESKPQEPTQAQRAALAQHMKTIEKCRSNETGNFRTLANAVYQIQERKLYLCEDFTSETAFFKQKLGYSRSQGFRSASAGRLLDRWSPKGDSVLQLFTSERQLRPLFTGKSKLLDADQDAALELAQRWMQWPGVSELSPRLMEAAVLFLNPPEAPAGRKESIQALLAAQFRDLVMEEKANLAPETGDSIRKAFDNLANKALALGGPRRSTDISWAHRTWNTLQGCKWKSKGCDNCYAAKFVATRGADLYPGLAEQKSNGKYVFTGKIQLLPQVLTEPLQDKTPKRWFVNSLSDLFHEGVPDEFTDAVFTVMEKAIWHEFLVLTKRTERMAKYTQKRYADREPPANIWLGTSTEDQAAFDKRYPYLKETKAAVRWLSVEPLLGAIKFGDMEDIDWVVVGGESGQQRREVPVEVILNVADQCAKAGVPVYVKQDSGRRSEEQGRIPDTYWDMKQFPRE